MLHVLHSVAGEMVEGMKAYEKYLVDLRTLVDFLSKKWLRERFMATCMNAADGLQVWVLQGPPIFDRSQLI